MTSTIFDVIWIASPIRIACNVNIISRPFLEVTAVTVTSLFLFNSLYLLPHVPSYIIDCYANYCKYVLKTLELYLV